MSHRPVHYGAETALALDLRSSRIPSLTAASDGVV
jgi:hypothetical protein